MATTNYKPSSNNANLGASTLAPKGKNPNTNNISPTKTTLPEKKLSNGFFGMGQNVAK